MSKPTTAREREWYWRARYRREFDEHDRELRETYRVKPTTSTTKSPGKTKGDRPPKR